MKALRKISQKCLLTPPQMPFAFHFKYDMNHCFSILYFIHVKILVCGNHPYAGDVQDRD